MSRLSIIRENVATLSETLAAVPGASSVSLRRAQSVICADCGVGETYTHDHCPWCGGYAQPMPNEKLARRTN
jgi:hypothetical protein